MKPIQIRLKTINQAYIITVKIKKNTPPDSVLLDTELPYSRECFHIPYGHRPINENNNPSKANLSDKSSVTKTQRL